MRALRFSAALAAAAPCLAAQGAPFQTPGMPVYGSQADRFSSVFNPAFSIIVDSVFDYADPGAGGLDDGFDGQLRVLELTANSWVDPNAWAFFVGAADEESLNIEEAAVHYIGLGGNHTIRAGRFFIDFGKQMQIHVHELRTLERPLALRAFLGEEVKGDGLQWDCWTTVGEKTAVRWSLGAFANLLPEEDEFSSVDSAGEALVREIAERKDAGDLNFTARLTGFADVGERGMLQLGASLRDLPDFTIDDATDGLTLDGLSNLVWGADLTYGWQGETGQDRLTLGGELLASTGDNAVLFDDNGTPVTTDDVLAVDDDTLFGWYAFGDYGFGRFNSVGAQYSMAELPDGSGTDAHEIEVYYTRMFSEFHRLRLVLASADLDDQGKDDLRIAVQYTATLGAHGHGVSF